MLLDKGADINAQGGGCGNALQAASYEGHQSLEVVKLLLDKGVDYNTKSGSYDNMLYVASYKGYVKIVEILLNKVAGFSYKDY